MNFGTVILAFGIFNLAAYGRAFPLGDLLSADSNDDELSAIAVEGNSGESRVEPLSSDRSVEVLMVSEPETSYSAKNQRTRLVGSFKRALLKQRMNKALLKSNKKLLKIRKMKLISDFLFRKMLRTQQYQE